MNIQLATRDEQKKAVEVGHVSVRPIENPKVMQFSAGKRPEFFRDFEECGFNYKRTFGGHHDCFAFIQEDGWFLIVWYEFGGYQGNYQLFSNKREYDVACGQHPERDPEGRGGRFFPSDYQRLKIDHVDIPSEVSVTGREHDPRCSCFHCGEPTPVYTVKFAYGDEIGYVPFCEDCYPYE